jgi:hypothetical protein
MALVRTPIRSLPPSIARWSARARWLRWADALAGWLVAWALLALMFPDAGADVHVVGATAAAVVFALVPVLRTRWRPVTACVGLAVSRGLRPGDRAWYVRPGDVERVLVTGRRLLRVVIVTTERGASEGIAVRRTRVLLIPDEGRQRL